MDTSSPSSDAPPLPHLSGLPPVPQIVKQARTGLVLSVAAWSLFIAGPVLVTVVGGKNAYLLSLPRTGWKINRDTIGSLVFLGSGLFGLAGLALGIATREHITGRVARVVGGIHLSLWTFLVAVATFFGYR